MFQAIVHANRQLNLLLDSPLSPADSFQQVTLAFQTGTSLRAHFAGKRIPETPAFERKKTPENVEQRLMRCYEHIREIATISNVNIADLQDIDYGSEAITPSDVCDLASLIVAELEHLHILLKAEKPSHFSYPPGQKFPAHVYQRVGLLEAQLLDLVQLVRQDTRWLTNGGRASR